MFVWIEYPQSLRDSAIAWMSDSDDSVSSSAESGSDLDSELDEPPPKHTNEIDCNLDFDPETQNLVPDLVEFSHNKMRTCLASARYTVPPQDRLPPRKRAKTARSQPPRSRYSEDGEESDQDLVIVSRVDGYFHLACPIYASDPKKHQKCLKEHNFLCIEEIISHLRQDHVEPPYCPTCWQTFDTMVDRDQHIRSMTCKFHSKPSIDGVTESDIADMKKRDRLYLSERRRWLRI
ncbi:hypothetical protein QQZ08_005301 [Neonectria magnoliae]|uniref:C2H2-type domain-containing protein n=1 Tax=Neonectria magnoliae TaxID=2732573 RepID=A0ABR1I3V8_9HYPO